MDSIDELFSRDPEGYGHGDGEELDQVVIALRKQSAIWKAAEAAGATRAPSAAKTKSTKPAVTDLSDLGLD